jgi:hypothetical protein
VAEAEEVDAIGAGAGAKVAVEVSVEAVGKMREEKRMRRMSRWNECASRGTFCLPRQRENISNLDETIY